MKYEPPDGSKIKVERDVHSTSYTWRDKERGLTRLLHFAFGCFVTCFSTFFEIEAIKQFLTGIEEGKVGFIIVFSIVMGVIFILGGIGLIYFALRSGRPFNLTLSPGDLKYKIGDINFRTISKDKIKDLNDMVALINKYKKFKKRIYEVKTPEITNLKLEKIGERKMLSFDHGADRVEVGEVLSDSEREWLYEIIRRHISS